MAAIADLACSVHTSLNQWRQTSPSTDAIGTLAVLVGACMPGHIDLLDSRQVVGWALEADRKTPDRVIIYVDGKEIAQIRPTFFRPDLRDAGLGDGWSGFKFFFPTFLGVREPANVVVRAASSGEILPHKVGDETFLAGRAVEAVFWLSLQRGFTRGAYAAEATGVLLPQMAEQSLAASGAALSADCGDCLALTARVLAPRDAILAVVPSKQCSGIVVGEVVKTSEVNLALPPSASVVLEISFDVHGSDLTGQKLLTFDLIDRNPNNADMTSVRLAPWHACAFLAITLGFQFLGRKITSGPADRCP